MGRLHALGLSGLVCVLVTVARVSAQSTNHLSQVVLVDVPALAVLPVGDNGTFRNITTPLNPTNSAPPHFQVWDRAFLDILGPKPLVRLIAERDDFAFAHEAPIWNPATDEVFFASSPTSAGVSPLTNNNQISKISLKDVHGTGTQNITFTKIQITPDLQMVNGGTPFKDKLLFVASGNLNSPPGLALVEPRPPYNSTTILDNLHGRQFNSINDVKVHPKSGALFFTDVPTGFLINFRPPPLLPNQVYRFDPNTGQLRVVADGFQGCNGIAFSPDGSLAYVTDTALLQPSGASDSTKPTTIYAFDVDKKSQTFMNRRVFAYPDTGLPDGVQVDSKGNIFASCGDGVQVFNTSGVLLGKIFLGTTSANHIFAGKGRLVVLAETKIFLVDFAAAPSLVELQS